MAPRLTARDLTIRPAAAKSKELLSKIHCDAAAMTRPVLVLRARDEQPPGRTSFEVRPGGIGPGALWAAAAGVRPVDQEA